MTLLAATTRGVDHPSIESKKQWRREGNKQNASPTYRQASRHQEVLDKWMDKLTGLPIHSNPTCRTVGTMTIADHHHYDRYFFRRLRRKHTATKRVKCIQFSGQLIDFYHHHPPPVTTSMHHKRRMQVPRSSNLMRLIISLSGTWVISGSRPDPFSARIIISRIKKLFNVNSVW